MVIWVMGGPGSAKTEKMEDIAAQHPEWRLIDVSKLVWNFLSQGGDSTVQSISVQQYTRDRLYGNRI